jgi:opacity protein-like surface antigen
MLWKSAVVATCRGVREEEEMRMLWMVLAAVVLCPFGQVRGESVSAYLGYQYGDDAEHGVGPGISYSIPLEYNLRVDARLAWYEFLDLDLQMFPVGLVGAMEFELDSGTTLYGGLGVGYYILNADRGDADNEVGFQILGGAQWDLATAPWSGFAELRWLFLESDVDNTFRTIEGTGSTLDLGGIGINLGITYTF